MVVDDVLVVGAGIVGLLCALTLKEQGAGVRIFDAGTSRPSASWAGGGILSPLFPWRYPDSVAALTRHARRDYRHWCDAIAEIGMPAELHEGGMFVEASLDDDIGAWAQRHGIKAEHRERSSLISNAPEVSGVWMPEIASIRNPHILKGLRQLAIQRGIKIECAAVRRILKNRVGVELENGERHEAGQLLLAAGHWNAQLAGHALAPGELFPVRGQMLLFRLPPGRLPIILLSEKGYLIPRRDGLVLAGSTLEPNVSDCRPTYDGERQLRQMAETLLPELEGQQPIAQWAGIRPGCIRPEPIIRPLDDKQSCWLVGGHYRNGLVAAPATARLVADLLQGRPAFVDPKPYR